MARSILNSRNPIADAIPAIQSSPLPLASSPLDIMSPSRQQSSVFNALGSYADRIKDANGNFIKSSPSSSSSATPESTSLSSSTSGKNAFSTATSKSGQQKQSSSPQQEPITAEDDGPWETVQSTRARQRSDRSEEKEKEKRGSSSKNWRDRTHRDEKNQDDGEKRSGREKSKKEKGDKGSSAPPVGSATSDEKTAKSLSSSTKNAWGATSSSQGASPIASNPVPKQKAQCPARLRRHPPQCLNLDLHPAPLLPRPPTPTLLKHRTTRRSQTSVSVRSYAEHVLRWALRNLQIFRLKQFLML